MLRGAAPGQGTVDFFGAAVADAGVLNGDGYDDMIVGAYGVGSRTGRVFIDGADASGTRTTPDCRATRPTAARGPG